MNEVLNFPQDISHEIEDRLQQEGWKSKPVKPLIAPVMALPHPPIYKMHRYYARRPHNVFAEIIRHYTNPGDLILDPFCGGGVTVVESLRLRRRVIGVDLNPLATWVTQVEVESVDLNELDGAFKLWIEAVEKQVNPLFEATCGECGKMGIAEWFEWSNVVKCPECGKPAVLGKCEKIRGGLYRCSNKRCQAPIPADECERLPDEMLNVLVHCDHCDKRIIRKAKKDDVQRYQDIQASYLKTVKREKLVIPDDPFPDMNHVRENNLFNKGLYYFRDYFTKRLLIAISRLKQQIDQEEMPKTVRNSLYHIFSANLQYTNRLVYRDPFWRGLSPREWPGHMYWPPYDYLEVNPLATIRKKYKALRNGKKEQQDDFGTFSRFPKSYKHWEEISHGRATCWLLTRSSHDLPIPDKSIDAVITDPPFGGNVQYAELSDFYLVWVKEFLGLENGANKELEAIETRHQGFAGAKDRKFYENMLYKVFLECRRVLKPDGWMALTFHNRDVGVWMAMNRAAIRAGFRLPPESESSNRGMIYQPPIENYTQTIMQKRTGSMLGDFILSFRPSAEPIFLEPVLQELSTEQEKGLYVKAEEIIRFHGGADETTLMTGLLPYLQEQGLLARLARFELRSLLGGGQFTFDKKAKKWFAQDMVDDYGHLKPIDVIPAESQTQQIIYDYLHEKGAALFDDILCQVYKVLVNAHRPQIETVANVLLKHCETFPVKGQKRELYRWKTGARSPLEVQYEHEKQLVLGTDQSIALNHNGIILRITCQAKDRGFHTHVGATEQRKNGSLKTASIELSQFSLGIPKSAFDIIRQIDLLLLQEYSILAAIEVVTSLSTLNKAVNDRFRNLLATIPNLNFGLYIVVLDEDFTSAWNEIHSPVNQKEGLADKIKLVKLSEVVENQQQHWPFHSAISD